MYVLSEQDSAVLKMEKVLLATHSYARSTGFSPFPCGSVTLGSSNTEGLSLPHSLCGSKGLEHMNIHFSVSPYSVSMPYSKPA